MCHSQVFTKVKWEGNRPHSYGQVLIIIRLAFQWGFNFPLAFHISNKWGLIPFSYEPTNQSSGDLKLNKIPMLYSFFRLKESSSLCNSSTIQWLLNSCRCFISLMRSDDLTLIWGLGMPHRYLIKSLHKCWGNPWRFPQWQTVFVILLWPFDNKNWTRIQDVWGV